jgi:hypothetical protein
MSNKKQTAVEWLENELARRQSIIDSEPDGFVKQTMYANLYLGLFEQAKEMEKQQAESIWKASDENMHRQFSSSAYKPITFEQYYNENYEI